MRRQPTISGRLRATVLLLCLLPTGPAPADPAWWNDSATLIWETTPQNTENWAPVNVGQLKNLAEKAKTYLDQRLSQGGGAGAAVTAICQFDQTDNYAPATVGQLKNVAKPFYDRLAQIGYNWQTGTFSIASTPYPWTGTVNSANQAPCNIGQLKYLFSFEITSAFLTSDVDGDGIPSWWEKVFGLNSGSSADASIDSDSDLLSNLQEYQLGLNPLSSHSGGAGQPSDYQSSLAVPTFDTDRDGLPNAGDAVPTDKLLKFPPVPENRYALIDLGPGTAHSVNGTGQVLRAWQTESNGEMVNHAEVTAPLGSTAAPSPVPDTFPILWLHGLSADGTAFFSAMRNDVLDVNGNLASVDRVFWSRESFSGEMGTHSAPTTGSWVEEWRVGNVRASGYVTQGGSLLNGTCSGEASGFWTWSENGAGMYGGATAKFGGFGLRWMPDRGTIGVNPDPEGPLAENFYSYLVPPSPVPGSVYNQQLASPDPYHELPLLLGRWTAPGHQGSAVHILGDYSATTPENPYPQDTYSFTYNIDVSQPVLEALPQAFTRPLATADIPSLTQQAMGPVIFTAAYNDTNCIAWIRTPIGWQQTEVFSIPGTSSPLQVTMPEDNHPVWPLGRYATAANARGEFLRNNTLWRNGKAHQIEDLISLSPNTAFIPSDLNSEGLICGTLVTAAGPRAALLLPVAVVELSPKARDEDGNDVVGSEKPSTGKPLTPFVEFNSATDKIAYRELKVKLGDALKNRTVTWTLEAVPGATPATIRGQRAPTEDNPSETRNFSATHPNRFEVSATYGENGFTSLSQASGRTIISNEGFTAIRVNVPPIGFNQVRVKIRVEGTATPIDLIDMEVPGVVIIDPGHGGNDSGTEGLPDTTFLEKDFTLAYGLKLREKLINRFKIEKRGLRVKMTRKVDERVELEGRAPFAKDNGADVFVSLHFNNGGRNEDGTPNTSARGTETFVERTPGNHNLDEDAILAGNLQTTTVAAVQSQDPAGKHRLTSSNNWVLDAAENPIPGVKRAGYLVIRDGLANNGNTNEFKPVKACLIEFEFLTNATALESLKLSGAKGRAIKDAFAENAAGDIFNIIVNQP